jgi:hypothetical protein
MSALSSSKSALCPGRAGCRREANVPPDAGRGETLIGAKLTNHYRELLPFRTAEQIACGRRPSLHPLGREAQRETGHMRIAPLRKGSPSLTQRHGSDHEVTLQR